MSEYYMDFMYKKISVGESVLKYWLSLPEFVSEIKENMDKNISITNKVVYDIVKKIYFPKEKSRMDGLKDIDFNYRRTRYGLNTLSKKIFDKSDYWKDEFDKWLCSYDNEINPVESIV